MLEVLTHSGGPQLGVKTILPLQWRCHSFYGVTRLFSTISGPRLDYGNHKTKICHRIFSKHIQVRGYYNSTPTQRYNQEIEKLKYDHMLRNRIIKSSIFNNSPLQDKRKLSVKTIILLIITSSTLTMAGYVISELIKFNYDEDDDDEFDDQLQVNGQQQPQEFIKTRTIFLPLWLNLNLLWQKTFTFPGGILYIDKEFYDYLIIEMDQMNKDTIKSDLDNYLHVLEQENIKYSVLEQVSLNSKIKQMFGLPLTVDSFPDTSTIIVGSGPKLKLWVESKYISVSGIQIQIQRHIMKNDNDDNEVTKKKKVSANVSWIVKPINIASSINNILISLGLKLDRLDNEQIKTHEKGSGKVHEVPILDKHKLDHTIINGNKDYEIKFLGQLKLRDKNQFEVGIIQYQGKIDFDHLMINRGIKIQSMDLVVNSISNPTDRVKYKVL
ncbi:hypothetical protein DFJ63DRAFT_152675 [Scheffersomyces coipomensis]|uniref:uncharacterized protein n=1 Tax=Scheffersomyces coipomensis TaxID=1788519 RepID=UPI00315CBAE5